MARTLAGAFLLLVPGMLAVPQADAQAVGFSAGASPGDGPDLPLTRPGDGIQPSDSDRVPRNVTLSASGLVTWTLDEATERDDILPYSVEWIAATRPVADMKWGWDDDHIMGKDRHSILEHTCYAAGRCRVQIEDFNPEWHYLVHVNTATRSSWWELPPVVLRHTPAPVEPGVTVADARVTEADGATLDFTVTLDNAAAGFATVDYATADGTATAGEDYTATRGTLTFAAGETAKTVSVPVLDDAHDEAMETLTLTLTNAVGMRIADGEATGTIVNTETGSASVSLPEQRGLFGLTVSPASGDPTALDVSWAAVEGLLVEYVVQWKTDGQEYELDEDDYELDRFLATRATSHRIEELAPNVTYTVKVIARLGDGFGPFAEARATVPAVTLRAVEVRTGNVSPERLSVQWQDMPDTSAYRVEYRKGTDPATRFTVAATLSRANLGKDGSGNVGTALTGLEPGTTYTVRVVALRGVENHEIGYGEAVGRTRDAFGPVAVSAVPGHGDKLDVSWSSPRAGQPYTYVVSYRRTGSSDAWTEPTRDDPNAVTERIAGLSGNTEYTVKVEAR